VLVVKLVLRGPPELHHTSLLTAATADRSAVVRSRFGLYIPRDGDQKIQLQNTSTEAVSLINAFAIHPAHLTADAAMPSPQEYKVPIRDLSSTTPPAITVPYRSTLKKFESTWVGPVTGKVEGSPKVVPQGWLAGNLTNATGVQLRNVYIAFKYPDYQNQDFILYLPTWEPGITLDLAKEYNVDSNGDRVTTINPDVSGATPDSGRKIRGPMQFWELYWSRTVKRAGSNIGEGFVGDLEERVPRSIPVMTFFDRLTPLKNERGTGEGDRVEILRRGGRHWDRSAAIAAGSMVVLAQAPGQLPYPLTVEGDPVPGDGLNFYQFVVPLDRSAMNVAEDDAATTKPATQPGH
jgi:hypothetical protein